MSPTAPATRTVRAGIERLLDDDRGLVAGSRVALVSNPASVDRSLRHSADLLRDDPGIDLVALFGPQHGFRSDLQDNMIETPHGQDARRQIPIYSLYSETREPTAAMLRDVDVLLIDLQDVGTRVYTYIYTMANCMRAAARHGVRVVVCDRPNPVGGVAVEGAALRPEYARSSDSSRSRCVTASPSARSPVSSTRNSASAPRSTSSRSTAGRATCTSTPPGCRGSSRRRTCRRSTARSSIRAPSSSRERCSPRGAARRGHSS
jgi:hypothetical protein